MRPTVLLSAACAGLVAAHSQAPIVPEGADWMTKHMAGMYHAFPLLAPTSLT